MVEIQIKITYHFNLIRLPKMNDNTTVWESKEQWELSYNSVAVKIDVVTIESNLAICNWEKMNNQNIFNRQKINYSVYSYNG